MTCLMGINKDSLDWLAHRYNLMTLSCHTGVPQHAIRNKHRIAISSSNPNSSVSLYGEWGGGGGGLSLMWGIPRVSVDAHGRVDVWGAEARACIVCRCVRSNMAAVPLCAGFFSRRERWSGRQPRSQWRCQGPLTQDDMKMKYQLGVVGTPFMILALAPFLELSVVLYIYIQFR